MNGIKRILIVAGIVLSIASTLAWCAEAGTARKAADVKDAPFRDAQTVGALATNDEVDILKKQGGWYEVKSGKLEGWVRMLTIRRADTRDSGRSPAT